MATLEDTTSSVPAAVQELLEREAIREIIVRFCRGSDRNLKELAESCYHPEAVDDHGIYNGPALEFFDATADSRARTLVVHHHLGQSRIELKGDSAVGETSCIATTVTPSDDGPRMFVLMVRYLDQFEKRDGEWKIANRFVAFDAQIDLPGGLPTLVPERNWGRRDENDPSHALFAALGL